MATSYSVYGTVVALGDSTVATYAGGNQVVDYLFTNDQITQGWTATNIAVPGHTIAQQKTTYLATGNRATFDVTVVQIGLNDLIPGEVASVAIARLQDLIDTINSNKKAGSKILIATMIPPKQRLIDVYGGTNGLISYQKWIDMNEAIKGNGLTPVTGVDYRVSNHTALLNDGSGNLASIYDTGDHIHENNAARTIIGHIWRDGIAHMGLLDAVAPSTPTIGTVTGGVGSVSVAFTISDFDGGADVTYTAISTPGNITGTGSSSPITVTGLTGGTPYTFKVYGTNSAGSSSQSSASNSVTPTSPADITAPIISEITAVSSPTNDVTPTYIFTTNEAGTISYGGACSSATTSATVGSNTITFNTLFEGTHSNCTITVTDASSNTSIPLSVTAFTVDTSAPTVSLLSPTDNATSVSLTANLVITFNEVVTVNTGNILIRKTSDDTIVETIDVASGLVTGTGTTTITIDPSVSLSSATEYYVQITSGAFRDAVLNSYAGISSTTVWSFTVSDTTVPIVSMTAPINNTTVSGASVTISAVASDNVGVVGVQFKLDDTIDVGSEDMTSAYSVTWDSTAVSDGIHTLSAVARDADGNMTTALEINVTVDNTAPLRTTGTPIGTLAFGTTTETLSITTNEAATCKYSTNAGTAYSSMTVFMTTAGTSHSQTISGLSNGNSYAYYVKCSDTQGNINGSDYSLMFSVSTYTPVPVLVRNSGGVIAIPSFSVNTPALVAFPSPDTCPSFIRTLKFGMQGDDVAALQRLLGVLSDGKFGQGTQQKVKSFQSLRGLVADGIVGAQTIVQVKARVCSGVDQVPSLHTLTVRPLKQGMQGDDVAALQRLLGVLSDGKFGLNTASAVKRFQAAHGLVGDGIAGPKTMELLRSLNS
jgi:peptidoglycan hydrolase-like protein with peptidoglycan-binding domain